MRRIVVAETGSGQRLKRCVATILVGLLTTLALTPAVQAQEARPQEAAPDRPSEPAHQALPAQPSKLERSPVPPMPEGDVGAVDGDARIVADKDRKGNLYVSGELMVTYEEDASTAVEKKAAEGVQGVVDQDLSEVDADVISFPEIAKKQDKEARQAALEQKKRALERSPDVESVSYNYLAEPSFVPNDPHFTGGRQWDLSKIGAPRAWDMASGYGARVAVLDTGFDTSHPDLRGQIIWQYDFFRGDSVANVDYGYSAAAHGTHVAGTVAASTNNGTGVAGTAPRSQILAAKVCGPTYVGNTAYDVNGYDIRCPNSAVISALNYFAGQASYSAIRVANLSLGGPGYNSSYHAAIDKAWNSGIVVVAASGNDAQKGNPVMYPAAYSRSIAVASTNSSDYWASTSSYGSYVDVAAPGVNILSTTPGGRYGYMSGTSMAALLASQGLNKEWIRYQIESTTVDLGSRGWDQFYGYGRINAAAAVTW